jgi:isopropylmalate/homocitrate/citramalate synthase
MSSVSTVCPLPESTTTPPSDTLADIELTSPAASEQSRADCEAICQLGLKAKILTHVRCNMEDAKIAVATGVDGLDVVIGTSRQLMEHSHGKDMAYITETAIEVIKYVKSKGKEIRFSSEDSFRSDLVDLLSIYRAVDKVGVNRVGIADTVGCASPRQVYDLVSTLRGVVSCDIETHFHVRFPICGDVLASLAATLLILRLERHGLRYRQCLLRFGGRRDAH